MPKIIQTYWTKPIMTNSSFFESRNSGGWLSFRYNCASWMYSCLKLRQFYDVELYTDKIGYELLIEKLHLPYTKVHVCLDDLNDIPVQMWALSKLYTYSLQTEPFLHIDGDVYIWDRFSNEIENAGLVVQHFEGEKNEPDYRNALRIMKNNDFQMHVSLSDLIEATEPIISVNAGVLGGHDTEFINYYSREAFHFFDNNKLLFSSDDAAQLNIIIEQLLFYQLAKKNNKHISTLFENISKNFTELMEFDAVPNTKTYIHLIGFAKKKYMACDMLEKHLQYDFPVEYATLDNNFPQKATADETEHRSPFPYSKQIIEIFGTQNNNLLSTVRNTIFHAKNISENLYGVVLAISRFEHVQHKLWSKNEQYDFDKSDFERFAQARDFFNAQTSGNLLHTKYRIADGLAIFAGDFDILNITQEEAWTEKITKREYLQNYSGTTVFLFKKHRNTVTTIALEKFDQFLYYFSGDAISGEYFTNILHEELSTKCNLNQCRKIAESLIKKHLLYTRYLILA